MMLINKKYITLFLMLLFTACGFNVVNQKDLLNFKITEINVTGDNRVNFLLKNKLNNYKNDNKNKLVKIDLHTKVSKQIKEKNIKNEITKYEINIIADVKFTTSHKLKAMIFTISEQGNYIVAEKPSSTFNNEKNLIKILVDNISTQVIDNLITKVNEL